MLFVICLPHKPQVPLFLSYLPYSSNSTQGFTEIPKVSRKNPNQSKECWKEPWRDRAGDQHPSMQTEQWSPGVPSALRSLSLLTLKTSLNTLG